MKINQRQLLSLSLVVFDAIQAMDDWFGSFQMQIQEHHCWPSEHKNRKIEKDGENEEDEQNDATICRESIIQRRIRHKGIASLIRINLVKKRLSSL